ncbi:hypothetical protein D3C85_749590 [compost metagenome]
MSKRHPMQPVEMTEDHVVRFKRNQIICDMQELCARSGLDLNEIAIRDYSKDDRSQLMQLIGYSVSGYGNLSCARAKHVMRADQKADGLGVAHNSAPQIDEPQNVAPTEWDGEGHPPVGVVCEMTTNDGHNWRPVKIIFFDDYVTMIGQADGKVNRELFKRCDADVAFRPVCTPEQKAQSEREASIDRVCRELEMGGFSGPAMRKMVERLHCADMIKP